MTEQVIYELGLRDKLSAGIQGATSHVNALERSLGSVKGLLAGIGVGVAAFKLVDFAHQANEEWEKMEFSMSQVEAAITSTGGAAGLTFDELKKGAEETSHNLKFTQAEILGMQSVLLTFPAVTKQTFGEASAIIQDMSTRLGTDLKSSTIQVGKALQDPERGITALRKAGVNFSKDQQELIKHLVNTNRAAEAQAMILKELQIEFGGSALAAAEADKSFRLDKTMEENKVVLGEFLDQIKEEMMPALIAIANAFKNLIHWVKENWQMIKNITVALGTAWVAFKLLTAVPAIFLAIENAVVAAAVGTSSFGAAMTAALGPVALIALAIGGLAATFMVLGQRIEDARKKRNEFVDSGREKELEYIKTMQDFHGKDKKGFEASIASEKEALKKQRDEQLALLNKTTDVDRMTELNMAVNESNARINTIDQFQQGLIKPPGTNKPVVPEKAKPDAKTKAVGSKSVTINVTIQKLGETIINTTNIKEGAKQLHDHVVKALTGAVNDFQIVAGQ